MSRAKVFITRRLPDVDLEQLHQIAEVETWTGKQPPPYSILLDKVKQVDGLLCLLTDSIDRQLIELGTSLKVISQMAVGYDNIDVTGVRSKTVGNAKQASAKSALALLRK